VPVPASCVEAGLRQICFCRVTAADTEGSRIKLDKCSGCAGHLRTHWPLKPEFPSRHASGECQAPAHETFKGLFLKKPHHLSWPHRFDLLLVGMCYGAHLRRPPHHPQASFFFSSTLLSAPCASFSSNPACSKLYAV